MSVFCVEILAWESITTCVWKSWLNSTKDAITTRDNTTMKKISTFLWVRMKTNSHCPTLSTRKTQGFLHPKQLEDEEQQGLTMPNLYTTLPVSQLSLHCNGENSYKIHGPTAPPVAGPTLSDKHVPYDYSKNKVTFQSILKVALLRVAGVADRLSTTSFTSIISSSLIWHRTGADSLLNFKVAEYCACCSSFSLSNFLEYWCGLLARWGSLHPINTKSHCTISSQSSQSNTPFFFIRKSYRSSNIPLHPSSKHCRVLTILH